MAMTCVCQLKSATYEHEKVQHLNTIYRVVIT